MKNKILIAALWIGCSVLNFGMMFANFKAECPLTMRSNRKAYGTATIFALLGPPATVVLVPLTGFMEHGWKVTENGTPWLADPARRI